MLKIFNQQTGKIEDFKPRLEKRVLIYVCGPTVYDDVHIGNLRPPIFFDVVRRYLKALGYEVIFASNITDVDDKIIQRAISEGLDEEQLTKTYIKSYEALMEPLCIKRPDFVPKATEYVPKMIDYIKTLIEKGYAYDLSGDVYFRVNKVKEYGSVSGQDIENLHEGARINVNVKKEDPKDFTIWKKTDIGLNFRSPWSMGRPGWHTECAVMNQALFGETIDIHGGGVDLKFPHHENENAQSIAYMNAAVTKYWMHVGHLDLQNVKMSKSLGNLVVAKDLFKKYEPLAFKLLILAHKYQQPISYSETLMDQYQEMFLKIKRTINQAQVRLQLGGQLKFSDEVEKRYLVDFYNKMNDDFNTPAAVMIVYDLVKEINKESNPKKLETLINTTQMILTILGIIIDDKILTPTDIKLYHEWEEARAKKDFKTADRLRDMLKSKELI